MAIDSPVTHRVLFVLSIATAPLPLKGDRMGTHAITPDQKGNPIDVLAGDIFFTYVAHD